MTGKVQNTKNSTRAGDLGSMLIQGSTGFTARKRTGFGLLVHIFLMATMMVFGVTLLVYYESLEGCALAIALGLCLAFISHNLEKMRSIKLSLEFMNALFSSALGHGFKFCFVVKGTGEIVFYNRAFQTVFPAYMEQSSRSFDVLASLYSIPAADLEKIKSMMASAADGEIKTTYKSASDTTSASATLLIEHIERPTGFILVRGK